MCVVSDSPLFFSSLEILFLLSDFSLGYQAALAVGVREEDPPLGVVLETAEKQPAHNETLLSLNNSWGFGDALG